MKNKLYIALGIVLLFILILNKQGYAQQTLEWYMEKEYNFTVDNGWINENRFQYYIAFLDRKKNKLNVNTHEFNLPTNYKTIFTELDFYDDWNKRDAKKELPYVTSVMKTVYVINKDISFFTKAQITDLEYIRATLPSYTITKKDSNTFHLNSGKVSLEFDFDIDYYHKNSNDDRYKTMLKYINTHTPNLPRERPQALAIQYNYNYSKILIFDTVKSTVVVQAYYKFKEKQTLVISFTLSYINNLPPRLMGGGKMTLDNIIRNIAELIKYSNAYKR